MFEIFKFHPSCGSGCEVIIPFEILLNSLFLKTNLSSGNFFKFSFLEDFCQAAIVVNLLSETDLSSGNYLKYSFFEQICQVAIVLNIFSKTDLSSDSGSPAWQVPSSPFQV